MILFYLATGSRNTNSSRSDVDISGSRYQSTLNLRVWQGLTTEQHRTIMQAREKKSQEQVGVKKQPYVPKNAGIARRAKAAKLEEQLQQRRFKQRMMHDRQSHLSGLGLQSRQSKLRR